LRQRYALEGGAAVLLRPDGHVAARFPKPERAAIEVAIERMEGRG
jgi:3-(3-hydroxy-phenyl)propionate hydroxylase